MSLGSLARPGAEGVEMLRTAALLTLAGLAVLAAMRLLADVLVPFTLALFLALLLNPLIDALVRRMRWPRPVAVGVSFAAGAALLAAVALAVVPALASNVAGLDYRAAFAAAAERMAKRMPEPLRDAAAGADLPAHARRAAGLLIPAAGDGLLRLVSTGGLVLVFLLFLLLGRGEKPVAPDSLRGQVERRIQGYIAVTFLISAATGALVGLTLWLLGVPFAWLFGVLAFALNFVPNVGSAVATLLPLPVILLDDSMSTAARAAAIGVPAAIQFVLGNVVAPKLLGDRLQLSPVAVLLGLILLGTIWGLPGLILATPVLATLKIAMDRVPLLRPLADLLGGGSTSHKQTASS